MAGRMRRSHTVQKYTRSIRAPLSKSSREKGSVSLFLRKPVENNNVSKKVLSPKQIRCRSSTVASIGKKRRRNSSGVQLDRIPDQQTLLVDQPIPSLPCSLEKAILPISTKSLENSLPAVRKVAPLSPILEPPGPSDEDTSLLAKLHEKPEKEEKRMVRDDRKWMKEVAYRQKLLKKHEPEPPTPPNYSLMVCRTKPPRSLIIY